MTAPRAGFRVRGQYVADVIVWTVSILGAQILRYDFDPTLLSWRETVLLCVAAALAQLGFGYLAHLYRARHPHGSFAEMRSLVVAVVGTALLIGVPVLLLGPGIGVPRSTGVVAAPMALVGMAAVRYLRRLRAERPRSPRADAEPVLIYGAGDLGGLVIRRMLRDEDSPFVPVGIVDDDPAKRNRRLHGIPVLGHGERLLELANATGATAVVVAIGKADAQLLRRLADDAARAGLALKVLPLFEEVREGRSMPADIRDVEIADLIGRSPVDTQVEAIADYLRGRRVLVTGAGGSIGAELCRQIVKFEPAQLFMLDRDETSLQAVELLLDGHGLLDSPSLVLADIRDEASLVELFREREPEVVFHAAALKHLTLLEQYPEEAWKTNVLGTLNVLRAAIDVGVSTFVNISTDKAADPTSNLGRSKRLAERLTAWAAASTGRTYLSVRFGNVLGSRGSVVPVFAELIRAGGPVTVTHEDATRYFMTIPEACQLVVQAGAIGAPGEVLVLDMGEPVRILDIARRMIEMSGKDVPIVFTGLRPGEKLHERLFASGEGDQRRGHPRIAHTRSEPLAPEELDARADWVGARREGVGGI